MTRLLAHLAVALAALLAVAGSASAATVAVEDGRLTYTPGAGATSNVSFDQTAPETVRVTRQAGAGDTDPLVAGSDCTPSGDTADCSGVTSVVAGGADGDDTLQAAGLIAIPATVDGGTGNDRLDGGRAGDTLRGGADDDVLVGDRGNDTLDGGAGDDEFDDDAPSSGADADSYSGGDGFDTLFKTASGGTSPVTVTLDDQANDGAAGENDDVRADVEAVTTASLATAASADDVIVGSVAANSLDGGAGNDTLDGGAGNDRLAGGPGNDTLRARDGFADTVTCGPGGDGATVDSLDTVAADCESVDRADVGNANDDRPPAVAFAAPAAFARIPSTASTLVADAADDRGVARVDFLDDGELACSAIGAPFACSYQPGADDVGADTLVAIATDTAGQTATAVRVVTVDLFTAPVSARILPARDTRAPFRFRTSGRLTLPAAVRSTQGCTAGRVSVQIKAGSRTLSTRRVALRPDCTYASTVSFSSRRRFAGATSLRFFARFLGNAVIKPATAPSRSARVR